MHAKRILRYSNGSCVVLVVFVKSNNRNRHEASHIFGRCETHPSMSR